MPATVLPPSTTKERLMAAVMIGVDPHKGSHTAVAIGAAEEPLGEVRVRASAAQAERLVAWAAAWPERTWAIEGARGLGSPAGPAAGRGRRAGARCAAQAGRPGAAAGGRRHEQERPQRRPVGRHRGAALDRPAGGAGRTATRQCSRCGPRATAIWAAPAPRSPAACTPCSASWSLAASPRTSPQLTPLMSWTRSSRPRPSLWPAASSLPSSWTICAASTPRCTTPSRSWRWRSGHQAPRPPRSSASARSSPPP